MNGFSLVYPMCAMVALTFVVLLALFRARTRSVASGAVDGRYFKTYRGAEEPDTSVQLARHFANIFEAPTLFYAACLAAMISGQTTWPMLGLAWLYVLLRVAHAYIHTGRNKLRPRVYVYFTSWLVLLAMWLLVAVGVFVDDVRYAGV